jgi:hypothetical protein
MIAAAPTRDSSLGLVRLIFSLAANPTQSIPDELKSHLTDVIAEAKMLVSDPKHISVHANPEAIELALGMKSSQELTSAVEQITTFDSINPIIASKVLEKMGAYSAY